MSNEVTSVQPIGENLETDQTPAPLWIKIAYGLFHAAIALVIVNIMAFLIYVWEWAGFQEGKDSPFGYGLLSFMFSFLFSLAALIYGASKGDKVQIRIASQHQVRTLALLGCIVFPLVCYGSWWRIQNNYELNQELGKLLVKSRW